MIITTMEASPAKKSKFETGDDVEEMQDQHRQGIEVWTWEKKCIVLCIKLLIIFPTNNFQIDYFWTPFPTSFFQNGPP